MLDLKQKLRRVFTQNIDGLETVTGMVDVTTVHEKGYKGGVVFLHGDVNVMRCERCHFRASWNSAVVRLMNIGNAPSCPECQRRGKKPNKRGFRSLFTLGIHSC
jgi:NAD-dependent histone deacetylase SIR2